MAAFNKFNSLTKKVLDGDIDFDANNFKVMLTNTLPVATNVNKADITEIAGGNGYTAGGAAINLSTVQAGAKTSVLVADPVTWTASGVVGPFRYAVVYDDTASGKPLICWYDYGTAVTLQNLDTFSWIPDDEAGLFDLT